METLHVDFTDTEGVKHSIISDSLFSRFDADVENQPVELTLFDAQGRYGGYY